MIRLAANWSHALEKLLRKVDPPVDYLKVPLETIAIPQQGDPRTQVGSARPLRPVLLHGWGVPYRVGMADIPDRELLVELVAKSGTPYLSVHLDLQPEDFTGTPSEAAALERVREGVEALRDLTGLEILLENVAHYAWSERPGFVSDPGFITRALEASGAGLLLDLAHARVSAHHRATAELEYLHALPLDRVREIHTSGPRLERDGLRDRHVAMTDTDYAFLEHALTVTPNLRTITLEYGGIPDAGHTRDGGEIRLSRNDPGLLLEQLGRLDTIRKRASGVLRTAPTLPVGWHLDRKLRERLREEALEQALIAEMDRHAVPQEHSRSRMPVFGG